MFYLTLPSNSSFQFYPDNTLTRYFTQLPQPMELQGAWEVGLVEIQYPHTWCNIQEDQIWYKLRTETDGPVHKVHLSSGFYQSASKLTKYLNEAKEMLPEQHKILFLHDEVTKRATVDVDYGADIELSLSLQSILGMTERKFTAGRHRGSRVIDIDRGFYGLYVYCNLVEARPVGDVLAPLLRIVPIKGKDGDMVTKTYENIHYIPLQHKHFHTVEIDIRTDTGKPIPFERGKVVVTLHFKKQRKLLL